MHQPPAAATAQDLDQIYTALAQSIGRMGEAKAPLFLATLALALLAREPLVDRGLFVIEQAERLANR